MVPAGFPPRPETPVFLCCRRIGRLPSLNHRMTVGWSGLLLLWPILQSGQLNGCALVVPEQWTSRMLHVQFHLHVLSVRMCPRWLWMFQVRSIGSGVRVCQRRLEPCVVDPPIPQGESVALPATLRDHPGPIEPHGRLYGWGDPPITAPSNGTQSWLLCPLISLALAGAERAHGVPLCSTGPRQPVPSRSRTVLLQSYRAHSSAVLLTHLCRDLLLGFSFSQTKFPTCSFAPICWQSDDQSGQGLSKLGAIRFILRVVWL